MPNPLSDRGCRSGYEYAKRLDGVWRRQTARSLRMMAKTYLELYRRNDNCNALGIALCLEQLAENRTGRGR